MMSRSRPRAPIWAFAILFGALFVLYLPVLVMMISSVLIKVTEAGATPETAASHWILSFAWYLDIFSDHELIDALLRSLEVGCTSSLLSTVIGGVAAVALVKSNFKFTKAVHGLSFLSLLVPELVFALSLLIWFNVLHVQLSLVTVIIAHVTFSLSFVLMTVNGRLVSLDVSIEDAARDLGASEWRILRQITVPLIMTSLYSGFLLSFLLSFDDFLITFFTSGIGSDTLPIRLYAAMKTGLSAKLSALATVMFLFTLCLILLLKKTRGLKALSSVS